MQNNIFNLPVSFLFNTNNTYPQKLAKNGINCILDLLLTLPFNVINRKLCNGIKDLQAKEHCIIPLTPISHNKTYKKTTVLCVDDFGDYINIVYFSAPKYITNYLPINTKVLIVAEPDYFGANLVFNHPKVVKLEKQDTIKLIEPIYRAIDGISSAKLHQLILKALNLLTANPVAEWLDNNYMQQHKLPTFAKALHNVHNPTSVVDILPTSPNVIRLAIDEILAYHYFLMYSKNLNTAQGISINSNNSIIKPLLANLPFKLTPSQVDAIKILKNKLASTNKENILLQGDVGSGKTIVCFIAAAFALESGYQVAFLAPTDILANQHYSNFINYASNLNLKIDLLTGKTTLKNKKIIYNNLQQNKTNIVVGTHAVFQQKVDFANLGLAIIDEQHRFGVNQRLMLSNKGNNPNVILTTATPIPRTLALSYYGDIELVEIKQKPVSRKDIITKTVSKNKLTELLHFLAESLQQQQKIFWVCPLIEESDKLDLTSAIATYENLQKYFKNYKIFLMHGKLNAVQKQQVITDFKNNNQGAILVATTVIEVGIDIPSCNIMVIENSQNFGLSQLHQLRGRVGRGEVQGVCYLLYDDGLSATAKERLKVIKNSNNGFEIAEKDLELRGFGDVLGVKQSGFNFFTVANLSYHSAYLVPTINYAKYLLATNNNANTQIKINALINVFFKYNSNYIKVG